MLVTIDKNKKWEYNIWLFKKELKKREVEIMSNLAQALKDRTLTDADYRLLGTLQSALTAVTDRSQHPEIISRAVARLSPVKKAKISSKRR